MRVYGPGSPLVFSHIPKTAGTALRAALRAALQPEVYVTGLDMSLFGGYDDLDSLHAAARARVFAVPEDLPLNASFVAGHIAPATTMARYPGADHITVLRAPHVRVLSQWMHSRSVSDFDIRHWGAAGEAFRIGRQPLVEYLQHAMIAPNVDNTITRFLVWPHRAVSKTGFIAEADDDVLVDAAVRRLAVFGHVNVVENPHFMTELGQWMGRSLRPTQLNERTAVPDRMRPDLRTTLSGSTRELLDYRCRLDVRVWQHVVAEALPSAEPDRLLESAIQQAVDRYTAMPKRSFGERPLRRVAESLYGLKKRIRSRD